MRISRDKLAFLAEKFIGLFIGILAGCFCVWLQLKHPNRVKFLLDDKVYDKLITISTTLFGFLLAVLALVIQGDSPTIKEMKKYGSYSRLIRYNRNVVITSAFVCVLSLVLGYCKEALQVFNPWIFNSLAIIDVAVFTWTIIDVVLFVVIFYQIILSDARHGAS